MLLMLLHCRACLLLLLLCVCLLLVLVLVPLACLASLQQRTPAAVKLTHGGAVPVAQAAQLAGQAGGHSVRVRCAGREEAEGGSGAPAAASATAAARPPRHR